MVEARQQQNREVKKYGKRTSNPRRSDFTNTALLSRLTVIYIIIIIMVQQDDPGMPAINYTPSEPCGYPVPLEGENLLR